MSELNRHQHIERARLLLSQHRYKDAETQAGIVLQQNPEDVEALQIVGHCRLDTKQYDEALRIFQQFNANVEVQLCFHQYPVHIQT